MTLARIATAALCIPLLTAGCVTTATHTTTYTEPVQRWARYGQVESVRETVREVRGDPAAGAMACAIIGSIVGSGWGHRHNPAGAVIGAIGGAMIGANASQGSPPTRTYEVTIRFDDGARETFVYADVTPFRPGDPVTQTDQGLFPR